MSAEHVSGRAEPLNLKRFIYELDVPVIVGGCATYTAALHLMRTGAAGVLVGFGGGAGRYAVRVPGQGPVLGQGVVVLVGGGHPGPATPAAGTAPRVRTVSADDGSYVELRGRVRRCLPPSP